MTLTSSSAMFASDKITTHGGCRMTERQSGVSWNRNRALIPNRVGFPLQLLTNDSQIINSQVLKDDNGYYLQDLLVLNVYAWRPILFPIPHGQ